jgi:maltose alpha-D-glucosyltransferase/alpha-amylase
MRHRSRSAQAAEIDLSPWRGRRPLELLGRTSFPVIGENPYLVTLAPYGFFWLQLCELSETAAAVPIAPEFETLVVTSGWKSLMQGRSRTVLERDVLPAFRQTDAGSRSRHNRSRPHCQLAAVAAERGRARDGSH